MEDTLTHRDLLSPAFWQAYSDFYNRKYTTQCFSGGRGCISGDTKILTPDGEVFAKDFNGGIVYAFDGESIIEAYACRSIKYVREKFFHVTTDDGKRIKVTGKHLFMTPFGWKSLDELSSGDRVLVFEQQESSLSMSDQTRVSDSSQRLRLCHDSFSSHEPSGDRATSSSRIQKDASDHQERRCAEFPSACCEDVRRLTRKALGCLYHYWHDLRLCDGQFPEEEETYRDVLQRLAGVHEHNHLRSQKDGSDNVPNGIPHGRCDDLLSTRDYDPRTEGRCCEGEEIQIVQTLFESLSVISPSAVQYLKSEDLDDSIQSVSRHLLSSIDLHDRLSGGCASPKTNQESEILQTLCDMLRHKVRDVSLSDSLSIGEDASIRNLHYKAIRSISECGYEEYYDFFVPFYNNYIAEGFVNHNSWKSSAVSIFIILGLERDAQEAYQKKREGDAHWRHYLTHAICYRKVFGTCEQSVYSQLVWAIDKLGLSDLYKCSKSPLKIVRKDTGQMILFRGLDDPLKSKSIKAPFSFFRYLWFEEAAEFDGIEEIRSVCQSVQRGGHLFQTFFSFNPPETMANWINFTMAQLDAKDPSFKLYHSTYLQLLPKQKIQLGEEFVRAAENLRNTDIRAYAHEYLGMATGNGGSVFPNLVVRRITDAELATYDRLYLGLDFGFSLDPSAFCACYYDKAHRRLIIFDEIYQTNLTNSELAELIKAKPYVGTNYIMCDSAEPKSIAELEGFGINALPVVKTERRFGFKWLQSLKEIVVDPRRTPNAHREFSQCEYQKNKAGQFLSKYPEINDHFLDSCLVGETLVDLPGCAHVKIEDLVGTNGILRSYNRDSKKIECAAFCNVRLTRKRANVIKVVLSGRMFVECTPDHRIMTKMGWIEAGNLGTSDEVVVNGGLRRVSKIVDDRRIADVYDLEVPSHHNFCVNGGIVVHNCRYATADIASSASIF